MSAQEVDFFEVPHSQLQVYGPDKIMSWIFILTACYTYLSYQSLSPAKAEFLYSADLLNIPLTQVKDRMILWERLFPRVFNSVPSKAVRLVVLHK